MCKQGLKIPFALAAAIVVMATVPGSSMHACDRLWAAGGGLWLSHDDNKVHLIASDARGVGPTRFSPAGDRIAYAHLGQIDAQALVIISDGGQLLRTLSIPDESPVNGILEIRWRDERHVFAEGHVSPSASGYLEWDIESGRVIREKFGTWFAPSPDGLLLAQRDLIPHGAPPPYDSDTLLIDDKAIYPAQDDSSYHKFVGAFAWSPDSSRIALVEQTADGIARADLVIVNASGGVVTRARIMQEGDSADYLYGLPLAWSPDSTRIALAVGRPRGTAEVMIVNATGGIATRAPIATDRRVDASWTGPETVLIRSEEKAWRLDAASGKIECSPPPTSSMSVVPPPDLRRRFRDIHAEDSTCRH